MKRMICIFALVLTALLASGQNHLSERVYISTDKDVYVSGDDMFFSAFCLDASTGALSRASAVAYLEICSPEGPVQTTKVALKDGRGAGVISLKNTIPTGNYLLAAYTAQCFNEEGYDFESGSKQISIINPFTTERSSSGVELLDDEEYDTLVSPELPAAGTIGVSADGAVRIINPSDKPVTLSVSVSHADGIRSDNGSNAVTFKQGVRKGSSFMNVRELEYDGEIVSAHLVGLPTEDIKDIHGKETFFSVPGRLSDCFSSSVGEDGSTKFYTRNIYGNVDAVLEVDLDGRDGHLELDSPFKNIKASGLKPLPLSKSLEDRILQRSVSMQVLKAESADSLYYLLPVPMDPLFGDDGVEYILDDYTRFPLMEELFIEFIQEVRVRRQNGSRALLVYLKDTFRPATTYSSLPVLALLDGVPVVDHEKLLAYDPLLVEKIIVYPHTYKFGNWMFGGVVNFVTYKRNLPSFEFGPTTRIVDFQGVSFPVASYLPSCGEGGSDLRETILWHPMVEIGPGESRILNLTLPSYEGNFDVVVEGFDSEGVPQYVRTVLK